MSDEKPIEPVSMCSHKGSDYDTCHCLCEACGLEDCICSVSGPDFFDLKNPVYGIIKTWQFTDKIDGTNIRCIYRLSMKVYEKNKRRKAEVLM